MGGKERQIDTPMRKQSSCKQNNLRVPKRKGVQKKKLLEDAINWKKKEWQETELRDREGNDLTFNGGEGLSVTEAPE